MSLAVSVLVILAVEGTGRDVNKRAVKDLHEGVIPLRRRMPSRHIRSHWMIIQSVCSTKATVTWILLAEAFSAETAHKTVYARRKYPIPERCKLQIKYTAGNENIAAKIAPITLVEWVVSRHARNSCNTKETSCRRQHCLLIVSLLLSRAPRKTHVYTVYIELGVGRKNAEFRSTYTQKPLVNLLERHSFWLKIFADSKFFGFFLKRARQPSFSKHYLLVV